MEFDPNNNVADGYYVQIKAAGDLVRAYNAQLDAMSQQMVVITEARDAKIAEMVSLRSSITQELVGFPVP